MLQVEGIAGAEAWGWDRTGHLDQAHVWQEDGEPGLLASCRGLRPWEAVLVIFTMCKGLAYSRHTENG